MFSTTTSKGRNYTDQTSKLWSSGYTLPMTKH